MPPTTEWIAELPVVFVHGNGVQRSGRIAVGKPYRPAPDYASCPISMEGLHTTPAIHGDDELQALLLAVQFIGMMLHDHAAHGGSVTSASGEPIGLEHYFGPLLRPPKT